MSDARDASANEAHLFTSLLDSWLVSTHSKTVMIVAESGEARAVAHAAADALPKGDDSEGRRARIVGDWADAVTSDVIVVYGENARQGWAAQLEALGKIATHALVVVVKNPRGLVDRIRGGSAPAMCHTKTIAPILWQIGRVREHVYFDEGRLALAAQARPALRPRIARRHAFLVDTTPRTPQARRKLHTVS